MAHAKETTEILKVVREERVDRVTLNLSLDEAKTLMIMFSRTGGDPVSSLRRHTDAMLSALRELDVLENFSETNHKSVDRQNRAIYFLDNEAV